ncbi:hypothetical protein [Streptomyces sp. NPDC091383]|uniref:hypothetical protein n=1 Tax=Streptomyces sp. NPDC091383 TaxID=3365996 RepID=UPI003824C0BD
MGHAPALPGEAVALLTGHTGEPAAIQVLSDRRGSRAWKLQGLKRAAALRCGAAYRAEDGPAPGS